METPLPAAEPAPQPPSSSAPRVPRGRTAEAPDVESAGGAVPAQVGLYLHMPFCARKCPYCDFNTYAGLDDLHDAFVDALCLEIERRAPLAAGRPVDSVFLGGGTPTVLSGRQLRRVLRTVARHHVLGPKAEITSEANPGTTDRERFEALREAGVNRLSLGAQSFDATELEFLGRIHDEDEVGRAVGAARAAGFGNLSLDLIFGLPQQTLATWERSLEAALSLEPEHLSLYSLIVEPGTPLWKWVDEGRVGAPDDDAAAVMYEHARARLARASWAHYEVSNWSRSPAGAGRHNLRYWRNGDWIACGPGAHGQVRALREGKLELRRYANVRPVPEYIRRVRQGESLCESDELVPARTAMGETMMLGLRLIDEGVPHEHFASRHGLDPRETFARELAELSDWALLTVDEQRSVLTDRGLLLGNQVFERFVER